MNRFPSCLAVVATAVFLAAAASAEDLPSEVAVAEPPAWDQAKVTDLAVELAGEVKGLREATRKQPASSIASGQAAARYRILDKMRVIERETAHLATALESGEGRDETHGAFDRVDELRRDTAEEARRMFLPQASLDMMQNARGTIEEMRVYYTGTVDTRPGLAGPTRDEPPVEDAAPVAADK